VTVRQTAGLSAKGQPTDVDAGLPELVLSVSAAVADDLCWILTDERK
jgi:hypothetical protein